MKRNRLLALLLAVVTAVTVCACGKSGSASAGALPDTVSAASQGTSGGTAPLASLLFGSDYQDDGSGGFPAPAVTLAKIARQVGKDRKRVDEAVFCGDYSASGGNYDNDPEKTVPPILGKVREIFGKKVKTLFLQGNHDAWDSRLLAASGAHESGSYIIYVLNTQYDNPWRQGASGSEETVDAAAGRLKTFLQGLIDSGDSRPVFIVTHVPLHRSARTTELGGGDNLYAGRFFSVINAAAEKLDIVFLFGHNHSSAYDNYLGGGAVLLPVGASICIPAGADSFTAETLNFTYLNAGYLGYNAASADPALTMTLAEIYPGRITLTRYDAEGKHVLGAAGKCGTGSSDPASCVTPDGQTVPVPCTASAAESPQSVSRRNRSGK